MAREVDPVLAFQFSLEINNMTGYFMEVSGINSESAVATHKVVTVNAKEVTLQVPGRSDGGEVTLKRGLTTNLEFWTWREQVANGHIGEARVDGTIVLYNREYQPIRRWHFINAWPSKISGPQMVSDSNTFAVEEMTLVHEGLYEDGPDFGAPNRAV